MIPRYYPLYAESQNVQLLPNSTLETFKFVNIERRGASPGQAFQTKKPSFIVNDTHAIQVIGCQISTNQTRSEMYRIVNHPPTRNHPRFRISGQIT